MSITQLGLYGLLADFVYHRDAKLDQALKGDVTASTLPEGTTFEVKQYDPLGSGLTKTGDGFYYNPATGFVGVIAKVDGQTYVVFRGTDAAAATTTQVISSIVGLSTTIDNKDIAQDIGLGNPGGVVSGVLSINAAQTQADDAIALTKLAIANVGKDNVTAIGQSLGGGLAAVVSVLLDIKAKTIDEAPFKGWIFQTGVWKTAIEKFNSIHTNSPIYVSNDFYSFSETGKYLELQRNYGSLGNTAVIDEIKITVDDLANTYRQRISSSNIEAYRILGEALSNYGGGAADGGGNGLTVI
jgi:hypothetical protein